MPVPHQPPNNLPLASSLPKVSFRKISEDEAQVLSVPAGVQDQHHVNFGFNDGTGFEKPEHYLRYVEPIESELSKQVEYDMDEQDQEWLDALNQDRKREQLDAVSYELFEIIIDRLEKEWFDLMKRVPQKSIPIGLGPNGEPVIDGGEDTDCAICDDGECENSNAIVFCDGCNLAVHQDCYGIPYIPEGQWLCRKCTVSPDRAVSCVLCPHEGGAFKQTTQGKWAHLLCAIWIPETGVSNTVYMEPIDSIERIPKARWRLQCYICRDRVGACIQCDNKNCFTAFHVTCGRRAGLLVKTERQRMAHTPVDEEEDENGNDGHLRAWCHKHLPKSVRARRARENEEYQDAYSQPPSPEPEMLRDDKRKGIHGLPATPATKKSARAYRKSYRMNISLVPAYIINRVMDYIIRVPNRKKPQLVIQVAKFWSLKREARRGAPLLKRLHLEPWTATSANKEQSDVERLKKLRFLLHLREDLEKVRMLAELVRKREREKQRQAQVIRSALIEGILFPYNSLLRSALERIAAMDRSSLFLNPVSIQVVPDYYEIVKNPMDWTTISNKLDDLLYTDLQQFKNDVVLVLENAMLYNKVDTAYHRTAARILHVAGEIFVELEKAIDVHEGDPTLRLEAEESIIGLLEGEELEKDGLEDELLPKDVIGDFIRHSYPVQMEVKSIKATKSISKNNRKGRVSKANGDSSSKSSEAKEGDDDGKGSEKIQSDIPLRKSARNSIRSHYIRSISLDTEEAEKQEGRTSDQPEPTHLEVNQVDSWDSFKRFNVGWVLPEGQKRSRMKPQVDKIGQSDVKLGQSQSLASGLDGSDSSSTRKRSLSQSSNAESWRVKRTRSASNVLTNVENDDENEDIEVPARRGSTRRNRSVSKTTPLPNIRRRSDRKGKSIKSPLATDKFVEKTLCWAKLEGYPFFPAEIYDEDGEDVPENVMKQKIVSDGIFVDEEGIERPDRIHLVRFFDATRTFGWVPESKLKLLFEDEELDEKMLKMPRQPRQRSQVRSSFDRAKKEVDPLL